MSSSCRYRVIVAPSGSIGEIDVAVAKALEVNGCLVSVPDRGSIWPTDADLVIMSGPMVPIDSVLRQLGQLPKALPVVFWYTEPLPPPSWPQQFIALFADLRWHLQKSDRVLRQIGLSLPATVAAYAGRLRACGEMRALHRQGLLQLLATFTKRHAQMFSGWGLPAANLPMGYTESFGCLTGGLRDRDIDVVFIGSLSDKRRSKIVANLSEQFRRAGLQFVIKDGSVRYGSAYGVERTYLLNRAKIVLSIMRQPWDDPLFRILLAAANGAMVLSEPVSDCGPFISGHHFVETPLDNMVSVAKQYLRDEIARQEIALNAHQFVTTELTMTAMTSRLIAAWANRKS